MAIRARIRRALRKSDSSDTISQTGSNTTTATAATSETSSLHKLPTSASALSRIFALGSRDKDRDGGSSGSSGSNAKERKRAKGGGKKTMHPSQRPLTLQNLKHQEMLSHFTMTFGASDPDQVESPGFRGVSPCCTRAGSVDLDGDYFGARSAADTVRAAPRR
ncbi:hypothetical protein HRG_005615 [Hirsutella rhossiliensis]|uniref:Uncharacterized protein n=1 Tax=Hirsutella rhossiliensis TaxID=111463 RepID=A0A9P8MXM4_9HYPO|nr:uncharacterized protein HRG_05615 [Hirsutella rhossiliensis]KAH0963105.1 hypothetical protein HRG_05615 [Hirsutella rhossiliensis]